MWESDRKEGWALMNWCFWIVLEKTLENPLNFTEIKPVSPEGNQPWIFTGRTDAEAPILWSPYGKSQLIRKDSDAGQDQRQSRKGWQRMIWLDSITDTMGMNLSKLSEIVEDRGNWCAAVHGATKSRTWLSDWPTTVLLQAIPWFCPWRFQTPGPSIHVHIFTHALKNIHWGEVNKMCKITASCSLWFNHGGTCSTNKKGLSPFAVQMKISLCC